MLASKRASTYRFTNAKFNIGIERRFKKPLLREAFLLGTLPFKPPTRKGADFILCLGMKKYQLFDFSTLCLGVGKQELREAQSVCFAE